jgi:isoleucyl-tRNA synthetase
MAPLYSFTCDEIWQYLPKEVGREESVHMARFVPAERLTEGFSEKMLQKLDDWDKLSEIRGEVLKVLETARKDKFIGQALEAKVQLVVSGATLDLLKGYESFLPYLFIVSQVELKDQVQPDKYYAETDSLKILVLRADGKKCERCWNYALDVGQEGDFETACGRCTSTLREMGF